MSTSEQLGTCDFGDLNGIGPHRKLLGCINWKPVTAITAAPTIQAGQSNQTMCSADIGKTVMLQTGAALEPGSAEALWKQMFPREVDEAGVCEFAEAYASKLRAEVERLKLELEQVMR